jgi:predicted Zn-dependent protease
MTRREKLEKMLAETPSDPFLRYAVALELAKEGNPLEGISRLKVLLETSPNYVPTYFQLAQMQVDQGLTEEAKSVLLRGIESARRAGDAHAEGEMRGFLDQLA